MTQPSAAPQPPANAPSPQAVSSIIREAKTPKLLIVADSAADAAAQAAVYSKLGFNCVQAVFRRNATHTALEKRPDTANLVAQTIAAVALARLDPRPRETAAPKPAEDNSLQMDGLPRIDSTNALDALAKAENADAVLWYQPKQSGQEWLNYHRSTPLLHVERMVDDEHGTIAARYMAQGGQKHMVRPSGGESLEAAIAEHLKSEITKARTAGQSPA
jgi:hypothetical protein